MADLKQICDRIKYLGSQPETSEARAEVEAALAMKWEGVQSVAARVLGRWGGRRSVELIKEWLLNNYKIGRGRGLEKVAAEALAECFEAQDAPWMLDIYFDEPKKLFFHDIVMALPWQVARERVIAETKHPDPKHRYAALIPIFVMKFPDACQIFEEFKTDPNELVRRLAQEYSSWAACP